MLKRALLLAPMAGVGTVELAIAVCEGGGIGALPCALLSTETIVEQVAAVRARLPDARLNLNFFCHHVAAPEVAIDTAWRARLAPYYAEFAVADDVRPAERRPFDEGACEVVERVRPPIVSFHFGLPNATLLARVKASGALILSSATTVAEAQWLAANGCDAIIAQGFEAGGHRASFLAPIDVTRQAGTFALLPQIVDAVRVPVVAAGGIMDARGINAALALGATAVQLGSAYLHCPEASLHPAYRSELARATDDKTTITNVFSGRPARGIVNRAIAELGPIAVGAPAFPRAANALAALRAHCEKFGNVDFTPMWAGQAAHLGRAMPAIELTRELLAATRA